jgi:hypothetical protein
VVSSDPDGALFLISTILSIWRARETHRVIEAAPQKNFENPSSNIKHRLFASFTLEDNIRSHTCQLLVRFRKLPIWIRLSNNASASLNPSIGGVLKDNTEAQRRLEEVFFGINEQNGSRIELSRSSLKVIDSIEGYIFGNSTRCDGWK